MKYLLPLIFFVTSFFHCYSQQYIIKGTIKDTLNNNPLPHSSVTLIRSSDSIMETYTRTKENGSFEMHIDSPGKYIVMATFPGFADYIDEVKLGDKKIIDLGNIPMLTKLQLLKEVIITKERAAIKIKGDTVEYVADSFKTKEGATVEELLKKLPGIEVDRNGQITAQGEQVQKIMVDGEEFFADDPAMVTKSLQAKIVDKVQVFDKKSEQAQFTGIDDGQKIKTINLQLKDKYKQGYLGKVNAGGGSDGFYQSQNMLSAFRQKMQFAAFGVLSNTNQVGLGYGDQNKIGLSNTNTVISDDGESITYYNNSNNGFDSWDGTYTGQGLPKVWTGGVHFSDKWNNDQDHARADYRFARQNVEATSNIITQYLLPDSQYYTKQSQNQFSTTDRHGFSSTFDLKPDTNTSMQLNIDAGYRTSIINSSHNDSTVTAHDIGLNNSIRNYATNSTDEYINASFVYRKKFKKKGRTFSAEFKENYDITTTTGSLNSTTNYFTDTGTTTTVIDEKKTIKVNQLGFSGKLTYTEPVSKKATLVLNYTSTVRNNTSSNYSYEKPVGHIAYDSVNTLYSSDYVYNVLNNNGGADMRFKYEKMNFSFGGSIADTKYKQVDDLLGTTSLDKDYVNFFPRASFSYDLTKQKHISLSYFGRTQQPTVDEIQPLRQNTDPLNIAIGNPSIKQQFNNTFNLNYRNYKMLKQQFTYIGSYFNFTNDAISQSINTNNFGGRTYQYINTNGNYSGNTYFGHYFHVKALDMRMGFNGNLSTTHNTQLVNGVSNISDNNNYTLGLTFEKSKDKVYSLSFRPSATYNDNHATISTFAVSYWQANPSFEGTVYLPWKIELNSDVDWLYRQKTALFDKNNSIVRWNISVKKKMLKGDQLVAYVYMYDLLNQNIGYTRFAQSNYVQENSYNTIARYAIIGLEWSFSKTGGKDQPGAQSVINTK